jgi:hypothetical protein
MSVSRAESLNPMPAWQRRAVYGALAVLMASGGLWLAVHHLAWPAMARAEMEGLPSPWEHWLMRVHGLGVFTMLFMVGRVSGVHLVRGWRLAKRRATGATMLSLVGLLAMGGYGLYYFVPDEWRDGWGLMHAALGLLCAAMIWWHRRPNSA